MNPRFDHPNVTHIVKVALALGPLVDEFVFVGGATVALFITRPGLAPIRPTKDVDIVAAITSQARYYEMVEKLRAHGFRQDFESELFCRLIVNAVTVDLMATDTAILGFSNRWYQLAWDSAGRFDIADRLVSIRLISPSCFLATKCEAFFGRGDGDYLTSTDIDDIVSVVAGRPEVVEEVAEAPKELRTYLREVFREWLGNRDFLEGLAGHLGPDAASQSQIPKVRARLKSIASLP